MAWDWKEWLAKEWLGKLIVGFLLLAGFLIGVVWRESLYGKWVQVTEGETKQALLGYLGLALLTVIIEGLVIAWLLILRRQANKNPTAQEPLMTKRFGVLWDNQLNPHCPVDETLMRPRVHASNRDYDILMCPKCDHTYPLRAEDQSSLMLPAAQTLIRAPKVSEMLLCWGVYWDKSFNPHCPVDKTPLSFGSHGLESGKLGTILHCPSCGSDLPLWDSKAGAFTLAQAKEALRKRMLEK